MNDTLIYKPDKKIKYLSLSKAKRSEKNPRWMGDKVGIRGVHAWIKRRLLKPEFCEICKNSPAHDLANISQEYKRDTRDWEWLCRRCHMFKDGRLKIIINRNISWKRKPIKCLFCKKYFIVKHTGGKFCSKKCFGLSERGRNHHSYKKLLKE